MKPSHLAFLLPVLIGLVAGPAFAQKYPARDIRLYVGYPPGTSPDVATRVLAGKLKDLAGRTVIVENKVGAAGNIATEAVARARPDGHTLVMATGGSSSYNVHLFKRLGYDPLVDLDPVIGVVSNPFLLVVNEKTGINSVAELVTALRSKQQVTFGANGTGELVLGELFRNAVNVNAVVVNYRDNAGLIQDLNAGNIDYGFLDSAFAFGFAREGRLKGLAVTSTHRMPVAPDYPTLMELGMPNVVLSGWFGIFGPAKTPPTVIDTLNGWFRKILETSDVKNYFESNGYEIVGGSPEDARRTQRDNIEKWGEYVRLLKLTPQ